MGLTDNNNVKKKQDIKGISWDDLIEKLLEIFEGDEVNIEEVEELLQKCVLSADIGKQMLN